uniref:Alpha-1,3-mannosyl-glycoprotein 2-beta-N-acetylglucosaminyltransferase n=1 Tax=Anisakis simplex TaxID=6269 RepID=A0A0M3JDX3_ANISI
LVQKANDSVSNVVLNEVSHNFTADDLRYLLPRWYDAELKKQLENAVLVDETDIMRLKETSELPKSAIKIYWKTPTEFQRLSGIFGDVFYSQGDLCSTCYNGIMHLHWRSVPLFIISLNQRFS